MNKTAHPDEDGERPTPAELVSTARSNYKDLITFHSTRDDYVAQLSGVVDDLLEVVEAIAEKIR
jgi:hypothetical protein